MRTTWMALGLMVLAGCSGSSSQGPGASATVLLPGPPGAPPLPPRTSESKALAGVDLGDLVDRERLLFWKLVSELYAPCESQAVSIAQCVEEARPCAACTPAARMIASKVHQGAAVEDVRAAYGVRFGPNVKKVEVADSPARGPADAKVTIVVWSDFECPHCRAVMPVLDGIFDKHAPRIRLVHKFYPLKHHVTAEPAARSAIAAQNQGRYWEMERLLFAHQTEQTAEDLDRYARSLNLDMKRFHADLTSSRTSAIIERDRAEADKNGLNGTPFILINGREFDLSYFRLDGDLEAWVALELQL